MKTPVKCPLREASLISGQEAALITEAGVLTYHQLDQVVSSCVVRLVEKGVSAGSRVGVRLENDWEGIVLLMACLRIGAVVCPVSTRLPELTAIERLGSVGVRTCINRDGRGAAGDRMRFLAVDDLVAMAQPDSSRVPPIRLTMQQPATIFFTSGSGGVPKAVLHTYGNHYYSALGSNRNLRVGSRDRWAWSLPLYHVGGFGILFRCFLGGATIVVPARSASLEQTIRDHQVTHVSMVATQLVRYLASLADSGGKAASLRHVLLGGGPAPVSLLDEAARAGIDVLYSYGSTEMASQIATTSPLEPRKGTSSGTVLPYRELRVDEKGEILVRGSTRFVGYVNGEELEKPFDASGWFATGDLGERDGEGRVTVKGRKDNQFISGGENIQPEEVERALMGVEGVEQAVVVPVPSKEYGQRPVAFVRGGGEGVGTESLKESVAQQLPGYMVPDAFLPWPSGPVGEGMKVDRAMLAQIAAAAARD